MYKKEAVVRSVIGLHARPATLLVKLAGTFKSNITLFYQDKGIDAKSIWDVLGGGIIGGASILVAGEGEDEVSAVDSVVNLIETVEN